MRISQLRAQNYRTLEDIQLTFPSSYTAICGANDCGKTNILRIIRSIVKDDNPFYYVPDDDQNLTVDNDFPKWKQTSATERLVNVTMTITVYPDRDTGLYQFIIRQLSLQDNDAPLKLEVNVSTSRKPEQSVRIIFDGSTIDGLPAQEVLQRIQASNCILFHNSTQPDPRRQFGDEFDELREISEQHAQILESAQKKVDQSLAEIVESRQRELEALLGRLEKKYHVSLSLPSFNFKYLPFRLTLGERQYKVPLNNWGSGTQNRTRILLTLFRAKQISESLASTSKITPVIVIEEPESFLHPAAQAEFGRVLVDLAEEFEVQVIVTTHSPYLLSVKSPKSNILLRRRRDREQLFETEVVNTSGSGWMKPFGLALGLQSNEFAPWKALFLTESDAILLVEGKTDKEYFELLRDEAHGEKQLKFNGEIVSYEGTGSLKNTVLLNFIRNKYKRIFVTFDLDASRELDKTFRALEFERDKHFAPIGVDEAGKRNIEGLLPDSVRRAVYSAEDGVVQVAMSGTAEEQRSAKNRLKKLLLKEFKAKARPGDGYYKGFYPIVGLANKALNR